MRRQEIEIYTVSSFAAFKRVFLLMVKKAIKEGGWARPLPSGGAGSATHMCAGKNFEYAKAR